MSSNLVGQTVVVVGGSSGIRYGVVKAALLEQTTHVIIGSSSKEKLSDALKRLKKDVARPSVTGAISGDVIDDILDVRFWGATSAAKVAKIRKGGSVTLTTGLALLKPPGWSLAVAVSGAVDGFTRGLAEDMAPIRVNSVCPGAVKTKSWDSFPPEMLAGMMGNLGRTLLEPICSL